MLPGMPAGEVDERAPVRAHLALDAEGTWQLSAHLKAGAVDPVWPMDPGHVARGETLVARVGGTASRPVPHDTLQATGARLVAIVADDSDDALLAAAASGAWAAVPEAVAHIDLAGAVRAVSEGSCPLLADAARRATAASVILAMLRKSLGEEGGARPVNPLSKKEAGMLRMVADGVTNREIAARMGLSEQTIKNYLRKTFEKMGTHRRAQAATMALQYGWLRED